MLLSLLYLLLYNSKIGDFVLIHNTGNMTYIYEDYFIHTNILEETNTLGMLVQYVYNSNTYFACVYRFGINPLIKWIIHDNDLFKISYEDHKWKFEAPGIHGHMFIISSCSLHRYN